MLFRSKDSPVGYCRPFIGNIGAISIAGADNLNPSDARSGPAGAEAEATSARGRGICGSFGPRRATLIRARSASACAARGLHVGEDRAFGA